MSSDGRVRDRLHTLVLRVLVRSLEVRLRDKMKEAEDLAAAAIHRAKTPTAGDGRAPPTSPAAAVKEALIDLEGVTCEPAVDGSTLWNFRCDGASYPARLVNLPCPVEVHKTHDHAMYYKSVDIAQMLVVYEDQMALEEAEAVPGYKMEHFPSYYPHGITPPMKRVVERRFAKREHAAAAPPRAEVEHVEYELQEIMERISKGNSSRSKNSRNKPPAQPTTSTKVIEEVVEDIVDYAPWMSDYGSQPFGIEFDDQDPRCTKHPELWLAPEDIAKITLSETEREEAKAAKKKKKKKKAEAAADSGPSVKKGIAAKNKAEPVDDITQAAALMSQNLNDDAFLGEGLDDFFNFDAEDPIGDLL